jgi:E3 ubiquitin-protein ligase HUWE1
VLNKFDALLEKVIAEYDIASLQVNEFSPRTKSLVMEILRFERMLLEHCTNRKIYASYDVSSLPPLLSLPVDLIASRDQSVAD